MKLHGAALVLVAALSSGGALAGDGFYAGLHGGAVFLEDSDFEVIASGQRGTDHAFTGFAGGVTAGYDWDFGLRTELEVSYRESELDEEDIGGGSVDIGGTFSALALMGNLIYDIEIGEDPAVTPYVGVGAGYAILDQNDYEEPSIAPQSYDGDGTFAYQGIAGLAAPLAEGVTATVDYRYFATEDAAFTDGPFPVRDYEYESHNVMVGLRVDLCVFTTCP